MKGEKISLGRKVTNFTVVTLLWVCMGVSAVILCLILIFLITRGIGVISWEFITEQPRSGMTEGGIVTPIVGSLQLILV